MSHFVFSQKKDRGSPLGGLNAVLYDRFYSRKEAQKIDQGQFDWYGGFKLENNVRVYPTLPDGLVLISSDKLYDFDLRNEGQFQIISEELLNFFLSRGVELDDCKPLSVVNRDGKNISSKTYFIIRVKSYDFDEVVDRSNSQFREESKICRLVIRLSIAANFGVPLFKIKNLSAKNDPIICSESFARGVGLLHLKGFDLVPVEVVKWPEALRQEIDPPMPSPTMFL